MTASAPPDPAVTAPPVRPWALVVLIVLCCAVEAVLQLAESESVLPVELPLATCEELTRLLGSPVGMLGYPGHSSHFPAPGGLEHATFHQGVVSRLASLQGGKQADV